MANLINVINKSKEYVLIDYDVYSDYIVVIFCPKDKAEDPDEADFVMETVGFDNQRLISTTGYHSPNTQSTTITPCHPNFDRYEAIDVAMQKAKEIYNVK